MEYSVGSIIKKINSAGVDNLYLLKGEDYFLQKFFINNISEKFDKTIHPKYLNLEEEQDLMQLLNITSSNSLFSKKNIFIINNFNRVSLKNKNEILKSFDLDNKDTILIFIVNDYYSKNKFVSQIISKSSVIDSRTPFPNKIKQWVNFYLKKRNIVIDQFLLENIIHAYNDDISNVLQEVEKIYLSTGQSKIDYTNELVFGYVKRNIRPWQLLNSLGSKNLKESVSLLESLYHNGLTITPIIISCFNFYKELYMYTINSNYTSPNYNGLNKILNKNMLKYLDKYNKNEIENIIVELKNIDVLYKTVNVNHRELIIVFMTKICGGYYE